MLSVIHCSYGKINYAKKVRLLTLKDKNIAVILSRYLDEQERFTTGNNVGVLNMKKVDRGFELRVGSISSRMLSSLMCRTKNKIYGYLRCQNAVVFVFGTNLSAAFSRTKMSSRFDFLKRPQQRKIGGVPVAPPAYEPVVWIFKYQDDYIKLVDKGRFSLL